MTRKLAIIAGTALLILTVVLSLLSPALELQMPPGFVTPILALEFMQSTPEILAFFAIDLKAGIAPVCAELTSRSQYIIASMDAINELDTVYILAYTAFLSLLAALRFRTGESSSHRRRAGVVWALAAVSLAFDLLENVAMLQITEALSYCKQWSTELLGLEIVEDWIPVLRIATHIKWAALPLAFLAMHGAPEPVRSSIRWIRKISLYIAGAATMLALAAIFHRSFLNEILAGLLGLCFLLGYIEAWLDSR